MRHHTIPSEIEQVSWDVIIIGAGINGTGIARDAAMRGLKVLLLEKDDISSGTSAWSSRLIHGGLRYLEYLEIFLVRESLHEREHLLRNAPHLVKPLKFTIPFYKQHRRKPWLYRAGMIAYDVLSYDKSLDHHQVLSKDEALEQICGFNTEGLVGAATYYDCQSDYAERLSVENALSAAQHGALILTHAKVTKFLMEGNTVKGAVFIDQLDNHSYSVRGAITINVGGPWVDDVLGNLGRPLKRMIGGTKGSHFVVDPFPGAPTTAIYYEARSDGRPILVVPWTGRYLIGSTDIHYQGDLDYIRMDDDEIDYLLAETNTLIPSANLTADKILYTYSGIRPLPYTGGKAAGAVTRRHIIHDHAPEVPGLISIIGGKLTTFRNLAQQTVDLVYRKFGKRAPECLTHTQPLPGAVNGSFDQFCQEFSRTAPLPADTVVHMLEIYGTRSKELLEFAGRDAKLLAPLSPTTPVIGAEILFAFEKEMAETLSDVLLRRTMISYNSQVGLDVVYAAAEVAQRHLGWDESRAQAEVEDYKQYIERYRPKALADMQPV